MNIKAKYLLEANLETLHFETMEWFEDVRFWLHKIRILGELVDRKIAHKNLEAQVQKDLESGLQSLLVLLAEETLQNLLDHEKYLSSLFSMKGISKDGVYRETHKKIAQDMIRLKIEVRELKRQVFDFLETE